jgi:hypothetical protein
MQNLKLTVVALTIGVTLALPATARQPAPKISQTAATKIALAQVPNGKVKSVELEREHGMQIYSFDIAVPGVTGVEEVQVSATTGKVVENKHESPLKEKAEQTMEPKEHTH